jgi:hypothetical protein
MMNLLDEHNRISVLSIKQILTLMDSFTTMKYDHDEMEVYYASHYIREHGYDDTHEGCEMFYKELNMIRNFLH